ncbi:hypothetical protein [Haladaptatus cibarius]|uniref:hypothetical protein n=1 Tax=Haladaptatus cibarius TaxID=453847 RepID=UPI0006797596|nr:hypothetical protein [Haladaptatus cibarius]
MEATFEDTPRCRKTWKAVRDSFSWTDDVQRGAWYRGELPATAEEFRRLWSLTDGICGIHFVNQITLYDGDEWLFYAVPHHNYCWLHDSEEGFVDEVDAVLSDQRACVLPGGTQVEWEQDGREYTISGTSLCVGGGGFRTRGCYGLSNLEAVRVDEATQTISLQWKPDPTSGAVGRVLMGAMSLVYNPPEQLRFEDETTFREVESVLREVIEKRTQSV